MHWYTAFTTGIGGILLVSMAFAMSGDLLWEDYFDRGSFDAVRDLVVAEGRVFAVGLTNAVGNSDMGIRAYEATDRTPLWEDHFDRAGGEDEANAAAVSAGRVFVAGFTVNEAGDQDFSVLAYRANGDGTPLWEDHYNRAGGADIAYAVAATGAQVFIIGITTRDKNNPADIDWRVQAYRADGTPLWQKDYDRDGSADTAQAVATDGRLVFVGGRTTRRTDTGVFFDFSVRAYRAHDGEFVWERHLHRGKSGGEVGAVVAKGGMVFVGGDTFAPEGDGEFSIYAFRATNGDILWQNHFDRAGGRDFVSNIAVHGGRVFAAGITCQTARCDNVPSDFDFSVRAYNAVRGTLLWEDHFDLAGHFDQALRVVVRGDRVFVVGHADDTANNRNWIVRGYKAVEGELLWQNQFDRAGRADEATAVAIFGNTVFVGGRTDSLLGNTDFSVQAYRR